MITIRQDACPPAHICLRKQEVTVSSQRHVLHVVLGFHRCSVEMHMWLYVVLMSETPPCRCLIIDGAPLHFCTMQKIVKYIRITHSNVCRMSPFTEKWRRLDKEFETDPSRSSSWSSWQPSHDQRRHLVTIDSNCCDLVLFRTLWSEFWRPHSHRL